MSIYICIWVDEWVDKWMNGWVDGQMKDKRIYNKELVYIGIEIY